MTNQVVIWGATGQAKVVAEILKTQGDSIAAVFDNDSAVNPPLKGVPIYYGEKGFAEWRTANPGSFAAVVAIGGGNGKDRLEIQKRLSEAGLEIIRVIHPTSFVAGSAEISPGCQVLANATIAVEVVLGEGCIVNSRASIDHESVLGVGVHVAPGATVCGAVHIGDYAFVGAGAVILPRLRIGAGATVGAGAVVTKNVPPYVTVVGNPARVKVK